MGTLMIANIRRLRRMLRQRERWTPAQLHQHQQRGLAELRAFAVERSPFYRRFYRGFAGSALGELPVLTKATLMDNFDEIATDPVIRLTDLQAYLDRPHGDERFAGRYWVSATSGSSGRKSIIPSDAHEWAMTIEPPRVFWRL